MVSAYSCCTGLSEVSSSSSVMPSTPFIGVRISWLMLARKSLLARLAAEACSVAATSAARAASCAVMSWMEPEKCVGRAVLVALAAAARAHPAGFAVAVAHRKHDVERRAFADVPHGRRPPPRRAPRRASAPGWYAERPHPAP